MGNPNIAGLIAVAGIVGMMQTPSLAVNTLLFMLCFAALGAGIGATFQLVPSRWPTTTAVAGGMIGEIGALGGSILPDLLGQPEQHKGFYATGFLIYAGIATFAFLVMRTFSRMWTKKWVEAISKTPKRSKRDE